jgi:hypothetical protein
VRLWLLLLAVGCGDDGGDSSAAAEIDPLCVDAPTVTWDSWAGGFFRTYCTACHAETNTESRLGAPVGVDFDSETNASLWAERVRVRVIDDGDMPVGGGVYDDDLYLLDIYLTCVQGV